MLAILDVPQKFCHNAALAPYCPVHAACRLVRRRLRGDGYGHLAPTIVACG
jgi:hypothetical protein